jgi:hypothetical protein
MSQITGNPGRSGTVNFTVAVSEAGRNESQLVIRCGPLPRLEYTIGQLGVSEE